MQFANVKVPIDYFTHSLLIPYLMEDLLAKAMRQPVFESAYDPETLFNSFINALAVHLESTIHFPIVNIAVSELQTHVLLGINLAFSKVTFHHKLALDLQLAMAVEKTG